MSPPTNTHFFGIDQDLVCRDEACDRLDVHVTGADCIRSRIFESAFRTRSRLHASEPWRAHSWDGLHESVLSSVSAVEPRNFSRIVDFVENDYGSCCERSIHRHLGALRSTGHVVRMDFHGRIHAYLRAGSRLLRDPDLVLEQIIELNAGYGCGRGVKMKPGHVLSPA